MSSTSTSSAAVSAALKTFFARCEPHSDGWSRALKAVSGVMTSSKLRIHELPAPQLADLLLRENQRRWQEALALWDSVQQSSSSSAYALLASNDEAQRLETASAFVRTFETALEHWSSAAAAAVAVPQQQASSGEATLADLVDAQRNREAAGSAAGVSVAVPADVCAHALALVRAMRDEMTQRLEADGVALPEIDEGGNDNSNNAETAPLASLARRVDRLEQDLLALSAPARWDPTNTAAAEGETAEQQQQHQEEDDERAVDDSAHEPDPADAAEASSLQLLQQQQQQRHGGGQRGGGRRDKIVSPAERVSLLTDLWSKAEWDTLHFSWASGRAASDHRDAQHDEEAPSRHGGQAAPRGSSLLEGTLRRLRASWQEVLASMSAAQQTHLIAESPDVLAMLVRTMAVSASSSAQLSSSSFGESGSSNARGIALLSGMTGGFRMLFQSPILAARTLEPVVRTLLLDAETSIDSLASAIQCVGNAFAAQWRSADANALLVFDPPLFRPLRLVCDAVVATPLQRLRGSATARIAVAQLVHVLQRAERTVTDLPLSFSPLVPFALRHRLLRVFLLDAGSKESNGSNSNSNNNNKQQQQQQSAAYIDWDATLRAMSADQEEFAAAAATAAAPSSSGSGGAQGDSALVVCAVVQTMRWFVEFAPLEDAATMRSLFSAAATEHAASAKPSRRRDGAPAAAAAAAAAAALSVGGGSGTDTIRLLSTGVQLGSAIASACFRGDAAGGNTNSGANSTDFHRRLWCFAALHLLPLDGRGMPAVAGSVGATGIANGFVKVFQAATAVARSGGQGEERSARFASFLPLRGVLAHCSDDVLLAVLRLPQPSSPQLDASSSSTAAADAATATPFIDHVEWSTICELQRNRPAVMHSAVVVAALRSRPCPSSRSSSSPSSSSALPDTVASSISSDDAVNWRLALAAASSQLHFGAGAIAAAANSRALAGSDGDARDMRRNALPPIHVQRGEQERALESSMVARLMAPDAVLTQELVDDFVRTIPALSLNGSDRVLVAATKGVKLIQSSPTGALAAFFAVRTLLATRSISHASAVSLSNAMQRCAEHHGGREDAVLAFLRCRRGSMNPDSMEIVFGREIVNRLINSSNLTVARMQLPPRIALSSAFAMCRAMILVSGWCTPHSKELNSRGLDRTWKQPSPGDDAPSLFSPRSDTAAKRLEEMRLLAASALSRPGGSDAAGGDALGEAANASRRLHRMWQEHRREMFPVWMLEPVPVLGTRSAVPAPAFVEMFRLWQRTFDATYCIELVAEVAFILREAFIAHSVLGILSAEQAAALAAASLSAVSGAAAAAAAPRESFEEFLVRSAASVVLSMEDAGSVALFVLVLFPSWRGSADSVRGEAAVRSEAEKQRGPRSAVLRRRSFSSSSAQASDATTTATADALSQEQQSDENPSESETQEQQPPPQQQQRPFEAYNGDILADSSVYRNQFLLPLVQVLCATICRTLHVQTFCGTIGTQRAQLLARAAQRLLPFARLVDSPYSAVLARLFPEDFDAQLALQTNADPFAAGAAEFCTHVARTLQQATAVRGGAAPKTNSTVQLPETAIAEIVPLMALEGQSARRAADALARAHFLRRDAALHKLRFVTATLRGRCDALQQHQSGAARLVVPQHVFLGVLAALFVQLGCYSAAVASADPAHVFPQLEAHIESLLAWAECMDSVVPSDAVMIANAPSASRIDDKSAAVPSSVGGGGGNDTSGIGPAVRIALLLLQAVRAEYLAPVPAMTTAVAAMQRRAEALEASLSQRLRSMLSDDLAQELHASTAAWNRRRDKPAHDSDGGGAVPLDLVSLPAMQAMLVADAQAVSEVLDRWSALPPQALVAIVRAQFVVPLYPLASTGAESNATHALRPRRMQAADVVAATPEQRRAMLELLRHYSSHVVAPFFPANALVLAAAMPPSVVAAGALLSDPAVFAAVRALPPPPRLAWIAFRRMWQFQFQEQKRVSTARAEQQQQIAPVAAAFGLVSAGGTAVWHRALEMIAHSPAAGPAFEAAKRDVLLGLNTHHTVPFAAAARIASFVYTAAAAASESDSAGAANGEQQEQDVVTMMRIAQNSRRCFPPIVKGRIDDALRESVVRLTPPATPYAARSSQLLAEWAVLESRAKFENGFVASNRDLAQRLTQETSDKRRIGAVPLELPRGSISLDLCSLDPVSFLQVHFPLRTAARSSSSDSGGGQRAQSIGERELQRTSDPERYRRLVESWTCMSAVQEEGHADASNESSTLVPYRSLTKRRSEDMAPILAFIDGAPAIGLLLPHMGHVTAAISNRLADGAFKDVLQLQTALWRRRKEMLLAARKQESSNSSNSPAACAALHLAPPRVILSATVGAACFASELLAEASERAGSPPGSTPGDIFAALRRRGGDAEASRLCRGWERLGEWCCTVLLDLLLRQLPRWRRRALLHVDAAPTSPVLCAAVVRLAVLIVDMSAADRDGATPAAAAASSAPSHAELLDARSQLLRVAAAELRRMSLSEAARVGKRLVPRGAWTRLAAQQAAHEGQDSAQMFADASHLLDIVARSGCLMRSAHTAHDGGGSAQQAEVHLTLLSAVRDLGRAVSRAVAVAPSLDAALSLSRRAHAFFLSTSTGGVPPALMMTRAYLLPLVGKLQRAPSTAQVDLRPLLRPPPSSCVVPPWHAALALCAAFGPPTAEDWRRVPELAVAASGAVAAAAGADNGARLPVPVAEATWHSQLALLSTILGPNARPREHDASAERRRQRSVLLENAHGAVCRVPTLSAGQTDAIIALVELEASNAPADASSSSGMPRRVAFALDRIVHSANPPQWDRVLSLFGTVRAAYSSNGGKNAARVDQVLLSRVSELLRIHCGGGLGDAESPSTAPINAAAVVAIVDASSAALPLGTSSVAVAALRQFLAQYVPGLSWEAVEAGMQSFAADSGASSGHGGGAFAQMIAIERPRALHRALSSCRRIIADGGSAAPVVRMARDRPFIVGPFAHNLVQILQRSGNYHTAAQLYEALLFGGNSGGSGDQAPSAPAAATVQLVHPDLHAEFLLGHRGHIASIYRWSRHQQHHQQQHQQHQRHDHAPMSKERREYLSFEALIALLAAQAQASAEGGGRSSAHNKLVALSTHFHLLGATHRTADAEGGQQQATNDADGSAGVRVEHQLAAAVGHLLRTAEPTPEQQLRLVRCTGGFFDPARPHCAAALRGVHHNPWALRILIGLGRACMNAAAGDITPFLAAISMRLGEDAHHHQQQQQQQQQEVEERSSADHHRQRRPPPQATLAHGNIQSARRAVAALLASSMQLQELERRFPTAASIRDNVEPVLQECTATDNWARALLLTNLWLRRHRQEESAASTVAASSSLSSSSPSVSAPAFPEAVVRRVMRLLVPGRSVTALLVFTSLRALPHAESWNRSPVIRMLLLYALVRALRAHEQRHTVQVMLSNEGLTSVRGFADDCVRAGVPVSEELCGAFVNAVLETGLHRDEHGRNSSANLPASLRGAAAATSWWEDALAVLALRPSVPAAATFLRPFADIFSVATTTTSAAAAADASASGSAAAAHSAWFAGLRAVSRVLSSADGGQRDSNDYSALAAPVLQLLRHNVLALEAFCRWFRAQQQQHSGADGGGGASVQFPSDAVGVVQVACIEHFGAHWQARMQTLLHSAGVLPGSAPADGADGAGGGTASALSDGLQGLLEAQLGPRLVALRDGPHRAAVPGAWHRALEMCCEARDGGVRLHLSTYRALLDVLLVKAPTTEHLYPTSLREPSAAAAASAKADAAQEEEDDLVEELPSAMALLGAMRDDGVHVFNPLDLAHIGAIALFRVRQVVELHAETVAAAEQQQQPLVDDDDLAELQQLRHAEAQRAAECVDFFDHIAVLASRRRVAPSVHTDDATLSTASPEQQQHIAPLPLVSEALVMCVVDFVLLLGRSPLFAPAAAAYMHANDGTQRVDDAAARWILTVDEEVLGRIRGWTPAKWVALLQSAAAPLHNNSATLPQLTAAKRAEFVAALARIARALWRQHEVQLLRQKLVSGVHRAPTAFTASPSALVAVSTAFSDAAVAAVDALFGGGGSGADAAGADPFVRRELPVAAAQLVVHNECRRGAWENALRTLQCCNASAGDSGSVGSQAALSAMLMEVCELAAIQGKVKIAAASASSKKAGKAASKTASNTTTNSNSNSDLGTLASRTIARYAEVSAQLASPTTQTFAAIIRQSCGGGAGGVRRWAAALRMCMEVDAESAHPLVFLSALEALEPARWAKALHLTTFLVNKQRALAQGGDGKSRQPRDNATSGVSDAGGDDEDEGELPLSLSEEADVKASVPSSGDAATALRDNNPLGWIDGAFLSLLIVQHLPRATTRVAGSTAWLNALHLLALFDTQAGNASDASVNDSVALSIPTIAATLHVAMSPAADSNGNSASGSGEVDPTSAAAGPARRAALQVMLVEWSRRRGRPWRW